MTLKRTLGTCYYPEHWPRDQWEIDAQMMVEAGLTWVRIGEFAWSRLEPVEGTYDFAWLDDAIDVLGRAGLKVVLGTPTATPPIWMVQKFPDMLAYGPDGVVRKFGSRRHYCFSHEGYKSECARITTVLGARYGRNPYVEAWQTDNEYGCHETARSYSPAALAAFRIWLAKRYGTIAALNTAWGNVFWSMEYATFDDVDLPILTVTEPNPSHVLAFYRFSSDQVVAFNRLQTEILREHTGVPLAHNYMGKTVEFDHFDVAADLDISSWDSYPLGFLDQKNRGDLAHKKAYMRQGDPDFQAFHHDLYRAVGKGRWWVMEQQPGPVNWAPYNPAPLPGMQRLWAWEAFAHGAEAVCYFRWRQAPFAQEQMHAGMLRPDSVPAAAFHASVEVAGELTAMPDVDAGASPVALVFDYPSAWAWEAHPQSEQFEYFELMLQMYRGLRRLGLSIDIVPSTTTDFSQYSLTFAPGLLTLGAELQTALATTNGQVIIGPRSGSKTDELSIPTPLPPAIAGLDCTINYVESLRDWAPVPLADGGGFVHWAEALVGKGEVTLRRADESPAMMRHANLSYLGGWPDPVALDGILRRFCAEADVETHDLPEGVRIRDTTTHRFYFNYANHDVTVDGKTLPSAGVRWNDLGGA